MEVFAAEPHCAVMSRRTPWLLLTLLASPALAAEAPAITVHVFNLAGAPDTVVARAIEVTTSIYSQAGIPLQWIRQPESIARFANGQPVHHETSPAELSIWLMPVQSANQPKFVAATADTAPDFRSRYQAVIRYDRVKSAVGAHPDLQLSSLLGLVFAHELGHLFLGPGAHERGTIMTARWEKEDFRAFLRGQLTFHPRQAAKLLANAKARLADTKPAQVTLGGFDTAVKVPAISSSGYSRTQ